MAADVPDDYWSDQQERQTKLLWEKNKNTKSKNPRDNDRDPSWGCRSRTGGDRHTLDPLHRGNMLVLFVIITAALLGEFAGFRCRSLTECAFDKQTYSGTIPADVDIFCVFWLPAIAGSTNARQIQSCNLVEVDICISNLLVFTQRTSGKWSSTWMTALYRSKTRVSQSLVHQSVCECAKLYEDSEIPTQGYLAAVYYSEGHDHQEPSAWFTKHIIS